MISLSKLRAKEPDRTSDQLKHLLEGVAGTAVQLPGVDCTDLQGTIAQLSAEITAAAPQDKVSANLQRAIGLLESHNKTVEISVAAKQAELRSMITITTDTISAIASFSKDGVEHLRKLEGSLESAASVEDLRSIRNRLFACLTLVRNEALRVQMESQKLTRSLKSAVLKASSHLVPGTDSITGLPGSEAATRAVHDILAQRQAFSAAILILADLKSCNVRLGRQVGDEFLQSVSEYLQATFRPEDQSTYRWNGPAFLILCKGNETRLREFEEQVQTVAQAGFQISTDLEGEPQTLSLAFASAVQRFDENSKPEQVMRTLEELTNTL